MEDWLPTLKSFLKARADMPETVIAAARDKFYLRHLNTGEFFLVPGADPSEIGIVLKGLMRAYFTGPKGNDVTKMFAKPGEFVASYAALLSGEPSKLTIQALRETTLVCLRYSELQRLYEVDPWWQIIGRKVAEQILIAREKREYELLLLPAIERYERFLKDFPELVDMIPQWQIASYLGITPVALSRLRGRRAKKPKTTQIPN